MTISSSLATKVGAGSVLAAAAGTSIYCFSPSGEENSDQKENFLEVEKEVINKDVTFTVNTTTSTQTEDSFTIKVAASGDDSSWGASEDKYSWECTLKGKKDLSIKEDLEIILNKATGSTKDIKTGLVKACSSGQTTTNNNKKISSTFTFPEDTSLENWVLKLFGKEILNKVEKEVLKDNNQVYFTFSETDGKASSIKATSQTNNQEWKTGNYSWTCILSNVPSGVTKSTLETKLPKDSNDINNKKKARKQLVYACAKDRTLTNNSVSAKFTFSNDSTSTNWHTKILGE